MSIITAIVQAILQAVAWVFPISESGHSSIFHDFASRQSGACSTITGVIHIGIAIGIVLSMYKLFIKLIGQFVGTFGDMFKKRLKGTSQKPIRKFMYMTLLSFVPMILWVIPTGHGFLYTVLHRTSYNSALIDDGIAFVITAALLFIASNMLMKSNNNKNVDLLPAIVVGAASVLLVPITGLSLVAGVFSILVMFGISKSIAFKYAFVMSVPVLIVTGIVEICTAVTIASFVEILLALIISAGVSFFCVRVLKWAINKMQLKYFVVYDLTMGLIVALIGIIQLIVK